MMLTVFNNSLFLTATARQTAEVIGELIELKLMQQQEKLNQEKIYFSFTFTLVLYILLGDHRASGKRFLTNMENFSSSYKAESGKEKGIPR